MGLQRRRQPDLELTAAKQLTIYADKCLTTGGDGASAGSPVLITDCTGAANQTWQLNDDKSISSIGHPALCLQAAGTDNGTPVQVQLCNGQPNQQWARA